MKAWLGGGACVSRGHHIPDWGYGREGIRPNKSEGEVLSGSTIGDSTFCAGGRFSDGPEKPPLDSVVRTFRCPGGTLTITFTTTQPGLKQSGDWEVAKGLVGFEGLSGGGRMRAVFESSRGEGRETFTGTVTR